MDIDEIQVYTAQLGQLRIGAVFYVGGRSWIKKGCRWAVVGYSKQFCEEKIPPGTIGIFNLSDKVEY